MNFAAVMESVTRLLRRDKNYYRNVLLSTGLCVATSVFAPTSQHFATHDYNPARLTVPIARILYGSLYIHTLIVQTRAAICTVTATCTRNTSKYAACSHIVQDAT